MADQADLEQKLHEMREHARQARLATLAPPVYLATDTHTPEQQLAQQQQEINQLRAQVSRAQMDVGTLAEIVGELLKRP